MAKPNSQIPFVSSEVETPGGHARTMGISTSLDANGVGRTRDRIDVAPRFTQADVIRLNNLFRGQDAAEVVTSVIGAGLLGETAIVSSLDRQSTRLNSSH